ncbi:hypothetical protein ABHF33_07145 [Chitinibacter sp. FCG-7]|uniref:Uncharacterized protein n=1 Tax=Chitinibacter mangrovi TaxID=3153927 RepID=A0AAU7FD70_9NEIS
MVKMAKGSVQGNVDVVKNEAKKIMHSLGFEVTHEFSNGFFNFDAKNKKFLSVVLDKSQFHLYDFDDLRGISIEQFATAQDRHNAKMSSLAQDMKRSSAINSAVSNAVDGATGRSRISAGISNDMAGIAVQASAHAAHGAGYNSARKAIGNIGVPTGGNIIVLSTNNPDSPIYKTIGLADQEAERTYHAIMALTSV